MSKPESSDFFFNDLQHLFQITASGDQTARLWDVEKAETVSIFRGHTCSLKSVAVQPNSTSKALFHFCKQNISQVTTRKNA